MVIIYLFIPNSVICSNLICYAFSENLLFSIFKNVELRISASFITVS